MSGELSAACCELLFVAFVCCFAVQFLPFAHVSRSVYCSSLVFFLVDGCWSLCFLVVDDSVLIVSHVALGPFLLRSRSLEASCICCSRQHLFGLICGPCPSSCCISCFVMFLLVCVSFLLCLISCRLLLTSQIVMYGKTTLPRLSVFSSAEETE